MYLSFGYNPLTGYIPKIFGNLTALLYLDLRSSSLSGELPEELGNLQNLMSLRLSNNSLEGPIPQWLGELRALGSLMLNRNKLEGTLPQSLAGCKGLQILDVGNNRIQGSFPFWTETLPQLRLLILRDNMFNGTLLPTSETQLPFPSLKVFDISHNAFTGSLPHKYLMNFRGMMDVMVNPTNEQNQFSYYEASVNLIWKNEERLLKIKLTAFATIDMSSNRFSGSIPNSIGILNSIISLNMSHNFLTGNIPASLGNVSSLESLDLSSNKLSGEIPDQLTNLTFLSMLDLSMNNLSGQIPHSGGQFPTFENSSYVGNLGLCGFPLTRKCEAPSPPMLQQEGDDSNFLDGFCWQAVVSGYGSGFVLGISTGYFIFRYGRPKWFVDLVYGIYKIKRRSRGNTARRRTRSRANRAG